MSKAGDGLGGGGGGGGGVRTGSGTPLSSNDLNVLVYRYLLESGFEHAAYTFGYQSLVHKHTVRDKEIPPGALILIVQKGLQFIELETNLDKDSLAMEGDGDFSCLSAREIMSKSTAELRSLVHDRREKRKRKRLDFEEKLAKDEAGVLRIESHQVRLLEGHSGEVFSCNWSPAERDLLASSSSDKTARLWKIEHGDWSAVVLQHPMLKHQDVGVVEWAPDGFSLATGTNDGIVRLWSKEGVLQHTLDGHSGPIFSIRWTRNSQLVLVSSLDKSSTVWSAQTGVLGQRFQHHSSSVLDSDWKNNSIFATCSTDKSILVCKVGEEAPLKKFTGHNKDVNAIKWDPQGQILASCSDDCTARIWGMHSEDSLLTLRGHEKEIYCMAWSPQPISDLSLEPVTLLATGSFDTTIRLWNPENGMCAGVLSGHSDAVYCLAFSPSGTLLASGSFDRKLQIWSIPDGKLLKSYKHSGGIFDVSWNSTGDLLAFSSENKLVTVIDLRA